MDGGYLAMLGLASIIGQYQCLYILLGLGNLIALIPIVYPAAMNLERGVAFYNTYEADALRVYFSIVSYMQTFENTVLLGTIYYLH